MKKMLKIMTLAAVTLGCGYAFADNITKPTTFTAGTPIKSAEMNADFDALYMQVNKIGSVINIDSTNMRVGIGTSSPSAKFEVAGARPIVRVHTDTGHTDSNRLLELLPQDDSAEGGQINLSIGKTKFGKDYCGGPGGIIPPGGVWGSAPRFCF